MTRKYTEADRHYYEKNREKILAKAKAKKIIESKQKTFYELLSELSDAKNHKIAEMLQSIKTPAISPDTKVVLWREFVRITDIKPTLKNVDSFRADFIQYLNAQGITND